MAENEGPHGGDELGMGARGVTRPMALRELKKDKHEHNQGESSGDQKHEMTREQRMKMLRMHHAQTLWVYWSIVLLGAWTLLAPLTFGYGDKAMVAPGGDRDVWLSWSMRATLMTWSDVVSGALLLVFGWRSLTPNRPKSLWVCCLIGVWISFAPVLFWAPTGAAYLNGTLVGMLVIALSILIPGMPNMILYMKHGPATPPGWSYNPSSWPQRYVMIALGFAGFVVSRYLAAFQLGYIESVWDPFFGDGTKQVLNSQMSHSLPVSDAALGTFAFTLEFLMGFMGSPARWRTMPWMVTLYGILVIPLGLVHIFLVISQPVVVGQWCTFCLLAAALMLPMLPLEGDEVIAMAQHLRRAKRRGESVWRVFWMGGSAEGSTMDERSPEMLELPQHPVKVTRAGLWGMSLPWTLLASMVLGIWLVVSAPLFDAGKPAADLLRVSGLLTFTVAVLALGEVFRLVRFANVLVGLAAASLPWFLGGGTLASQVSGLVTGLLIAALALPRGPKREHYAGWDRFVR